MYKVIYKNEELDEPVYCMAIINPQMCKHSSIQIEIEQRNEGPMPHFHVYLDSERNPKNCAYIRIDKAAYSEHHKYKSAHLNKKQKQEFINIMNAIWLGEYIKSITTNEIKEATGYERAVKIWLDTFEPAVNFKYDENGFPAMPDYSVL